MKNLTTKLSSRALQLLAIACACFASNPLAADYPDYPVGVIDSAGNQVALWTFVPTLSGNYSIMSASYDASTLSWSTPITISSSGFDAWSPIIQGNSGGNAVAAWVVTDTVNGVYALDAAIYDGTTQTWGSPVRLSTSTQQIDDTFVLRINANDDISITWNAYDTTTTDVHIWNNTGTVSSGFGSATLVY